MHEAGSKCLVKHYRSVKKYLKITKSATFKISSLMRQTLFFWVLFAFCRVTVCALAHKWGSLSLVLLPPRTMC